MSFNCGVRALSVVKEILKGIKDNSFLHLFRKRMGQKHKTAARRRIQTNELSFGVIELLLNCWK